MQSHVKLVAILNIILGSVGIVAALIVVLMFGGIAAIVGHAAETPDAAVAIPILGGIGGIVFLILLVISLPVLIGGVGLLRLAPWSRLYMIVLSAMELLNVPFGTALGIYSIWVLTKPETLALFAQRSYRPA